MGIVSAKAGTNEWRMWTRRYVLTCLLLVICSRVKLSLISRPRRTAQYRAEARDKLQMQSVLSMTGHHADIVQ